MNTIFVQIASYRDPELIPTIKDCISKAKYPELLSFGICWQHANEDEWDNLNEFKNNINFKIMDVNWKDSKGACWARHNIQNMWNGEKYTLQLDSHHRFVENWDEELINMMILTESDKPIITTYAAAYEPSKEIEKQSPTKMNAKFENDIILFTSQYIEEHEKLLKPIPARFVSGHYYFTFGIHCKECKYDPELYFTGEEISLSVRSFTLGYDLFHPHKILLYHEYTRKGRVKHWDDFSDKNPELTKWFIIDQSSKNRVRVLLEQINDTSINLGEYKLGTIRTLKDYENYSGINFKLCLLHPDTVLEKNPPINDYDYNWDLANTEYNLKFNLPKIDMTNIKFIFIGIHDVNDNQIFRQDITSYTNTIKICIKSNKKPYKWVFWPFSITNEWQEKSEFII